MKCRYDLGKKCTAGCKDINTCAWMKDGRRRAAIENEEFKRAVDNMVKVRNDR